MEESSASFPGSDREEEKSEESGEMSDELSEEIRLAEEREWKWVLALLKIFSAAFGVWYGLIGPDFEAIMPVVITSMGTALVLWAVSHSAREQLLRDNTRELLIATTIFCYAVVISHFVRLKVDPPRSFSDGHRGLDY